MGERLRAIWGRRPWRYRERAKAAEHHVTEMSRLLGDQQAEISRLNRLADTLKQKVARSAGLAVKTGSLKSSLHVQAPAADILAETVDANFRTMDEWAGTVVVRMDVQEKTTDDLKARVEALEAAALGEPLEEMT